MKNQSARKANSNGATGHFIGISVILITSLPPSQCLKKSRSSLAPATVEKSKIAGDEEKLAKEKQELMEKKQMATQERAEKLYNWPLTLLIIIGLVVVGLVALFFIGKSIRTKKKAA